MDVTQTEVSTLTVTLDDGIATAVDTDTTVISTSIGTIPQVAAHTFTVAENAAIGTIVGTVVGIDPDPDHSTLSYALRGGVAGGSGAGAFEIDANGVVRVLDDTLIDHEAADLLKLAVLATDGSAENNPSYIEQTLVPCDELFEQLFGTSVAIHGDLVVVGAQRDDDNGSEAGAAYIFRRDNFGWRQEAKVVASDGEALDHFGVSVAVSNGTVLVGAENHDGQRGAAYVYVKDGDSWIQQARLTASVREGGDFFGTSVALDGDTAVVGRPSF